METTRGSPKPERVERGVELCRRSDGTRYYRIDFRDQAGRRVRENAGARLRDAQALLSQREHEVRTGSHERRQDRKRRTRAEAKAAEAAVGPTFGEFADRFLREYGPASGSDYYTKALRAEDPATRTPAGPLRRHFADRLLREITAADVESFLASCTKDGPSTRRKRATMLGTVFKAAVRWGVAVANPIDRIEKPAEPKHRVRFLSAQEWKQLLAIAPPHRAALYRLAIATGMRLKELTGLRWEDVNLADGFLHVAEDTKTGTRAVPIGAEARAVLEGQRDRRKTIGRDQGKLASFVFTGDTGDDWHSPARRNRLTKIVAADMRAAGIEDASMHTLRHTAAAWMVQAGRSLYEVQKVLGHSTPLMTQRYAHLEPKHLRGAVEALDAAIRGHGVDTASATIGGATASADDATTVTATLSNASAS